MELPPAQDVTLSWETFTDAANEAGMSRRYGGIHFEPGDLVGRTTGRLVAIKAWKKAKSYINGIEDRREQDHEWTADEPAAAECRDANPPTWLKLLMDAATTQCGQFAPPG